MARLINTLGPVRIAALVTACANRVFDTPWLQTRVLDARTHAPIPNVTVTVWNGMDSDKRMTGQSQADGSVLIRPTARETRTFGPWDAGPPKGKARFEMPGYQGREIDLTAGVNDLPAVELTESSNPSPPLRAERENSLDCSRKAAALTRVPARGDNGLCWYRLPIPHSARGCAPRRGCDRSARSSRPAQAAACRDSIH
jgi:hypothetical protein